MSTVHSAYTANTMASVTVTAGNGASFASANIYDDSVRTIGNKIKSIEIVNNGTSPLYVDFNTTVTVRKANSVVVTANGVYVKSFGPGVSSVIVSVISAGAGDFAVSQKR